MENLPFKISKLDKIRCFLQKMVYSESYFSEAREVWVAPGKVKRLFSPSLVAHIGISIQLEIKTPPQQIP